MGSLQKCGLSYLISTGNSKLPIQCQVNFLLSLNSNGKTIRVIETESPVCYTFKNVKIPKLTSKKIKSDIFETHVSLYVPF